MKVTFGNVHNVRVLHVKIKRRKSLTLTDLKVIRDFFDCADFASGAEFTKQIVSNDQTHKIVHTVPISASVSDEIAREMGNARLDEFFRRYGLEQPAGKPKFDDRAPHRHHAGVRSQPVTVRA